MEMKNRVAKVTKKCELCSDCLFRSGSGRNKRLSTINQFLKQLKQLSRQTAVYTMVALVPSAEHCEPPVHIGAVERVGQ